MSIGLATASELACVAGAYGGFYVLTFALVRSAHAKGWRDTAWTVLAVFGEVLALFVILGLVAVPVFFFHG